MNPCWSLKAESAIAPRLPVVDAHIPLPDTVPLPRRRQQIGNKQTG